VKQIRVDSEVVAELSRRGQFGETFNDVIRRSIGLAPLPPGDKAERRSDLKELLATGLLRPGQTVTWKRRQLNVTHVATITADGRMKTSDGQSHPSPSACAIALTGYPVKTWELWKTGDGITLAELRERMVLDNVDNQS
jgi:hypothetical protein